ncbi:MAG: GGDEF domain-containing protein [Thalassotalea sp.]
MITDSFGLSITNQLNSGIIILDFDCNILYWNNFLAIYANKPIVQYRHQSIFEAFPELPVRWLRRKFSSVIQLKTPAFCSWEQRHHLFEFPHTRPITTDSHFMAQNCKFSIIQNDAQEEFLCISIEDATDVCHYQLTMQQALDELELANRIDGLTQVFNRKHWEECLAQEYSRARRFEHDLALIMFDLDFFKRLNDSYGHLGGDQVLVETALKVKKMLRLCDIFGRYGGEEFAIILPETTLAGALELAERVRAEIESNLIDFNGDEIKITASIGVAILCSSDLRYEDLIARTDEGLYEAKANGRNCVKSIGSLPELV